MRFLVTTIIAANYRPVHDRLCPIIMLFHYLREEPGPHTFHPLSFLCLSWGGDKQRLAAKQELMSPFQGRWLHFQLTIQRHSESPPLTENKGKCMATCHMCIETMVADQDEGLQT